MSKSIRILIADDNVQYVNLLEEYINQKCDMEVVGIANDGLTAIAMMKDLKPDVMVLDIIMPKLDGIGVLEKIKMESIMPLPKIIMLTGIGQEHFIKKAVALGAEYYMVKPFDPDNLVTRIREIGNEGFGSIQFFQSSSPKKNDTRSAAKQQDVLESIVTDMIRAVGIPPHMLGYQFIREAIMLTVNDPVTFSSITKMLYPRVADRFSSTPEKVERAIRNAIQSAWNRLTNDMIVNMFGTTKFFATKPTNSEFITMMAERIRSKHNI